VYKNNFKFLLIQIGLSILLYQKAIKNYIVLGIYLLELKLLKF
jgi:hypothetical protein